MTKRNLFMAGGAVVLGLALLALPSRSLKSQEPAEAQARLAERLASGQERLAERVQGRMLQASVRSAVAEAQDQQRRIEVAPEPGDEDTMVIGDLGASW